MLLEESLILARKVGDKRSIALSLNSLGHLPNRILGVAQPHETRSLYEESLTLFREVGDTANIAATLLGMGVVAQRHGDHVLARVSLEESVHLARAVGARELTAALNSLGLELMYQHDLAQAVTVGAEGLALCREQSDLGGVATALLVLGLVAYHQGDYAVARAHLEESVACWQESGSDKDGLGWALNSLGRVVLAQGEVRLACRLHQESLALRQEVSNSLGIIECMEGLAEVTMAQGQTTRAARLWGIAETLRDTFGASLPPIDRAHYARTIAAMRAALGEEQWAAVRAAGRAISLKQAMTEALEQLSEWPGPTIKQVPKEVLLQPRGQYNGQP
jgi:tetratricopeptide (TPR) repeat protein